MVRGSAFGVTANCWPQRKKMCPSINGANLRPFDEKSEYFRGAKIDKSLLYKEIKFFQIFWKWSKKLARFLLIPLGQ
jgi:hypothetical protein